MIPVGPMVAVANTIENDPEIRIKRIKRKSRSYIGESIRPIKRLLVTSQGPALGPSSPIDFLVPRILQFSKNPHRSHLQFGEGKPFFPQIL